LQQTGERSSEGKTAVSIERTWGVATDEVVLVEAVEVDDDDVVKDVEDEEEVVADEGLDVVIEDVAEDVGELDVETTIEEEELEEVVVVVVEGLVAR
jgi:hypothetical protein